MNTVECEAQSKAQSEAESGAQSAATFTVVNSFNWNLNFESSSRKYQIANMLGLIVDQLATERRSLFGIAKASVLALVNNKKITRIFVKGTALQQPIPAERLR